MKRFFFPNYTPEPDKLIADRYNVIDQLGTNGVEQTFLVADLHAPGQPKCVLKQLKLPFDIPSEIDQVRASFEAETKQLSALSLHECIPNLLAYFESEDHDFYLVQEPIEGLSLSTELSIPTPWSDRQVIALLEDVLGTVNFIHQSGVVHQNLQPANLIRRSRDHRMVVTNFGGLQQAIAHIIAPTPSISMPPVFNLSSYMPNEQIAGHPRPSSDIYAIGMIAIQALTGHRPGTFLTHPETRELYWPSFASVRHPALIALLERMVKYSYRERYQSAEEAIDALYALPEDIAPIPSIAASEAPIAVPLAAAALSDRTRDYTTDDITENADAQQTEESSATTADIPDDAEEDVILPKGLDPYELIRKREARRRAIPVGIAAVALLGVGTVLWRAVNPLVLIGRANRVNADTVSEAPTATRPQSSPPVSAPSSSEQTAEQASEPTVESAEALSPSTSAPTASSTLAEENSSFAERSSEDAFTSGSSPMAEIARTAPAGDATLTSAVAKSTVNEFYEYVSGRSWDAVRALLNDDLARSLEPNFFYGFKNVSVENMRVLNQDGNTIDLMVQNTYVYPDGSIQEEERSYTVKMVDDQPTIVDTDFIEVIRDRSY